MLCSLSVIVTSVSSFPPAPVVLNSFPETADVVDAILTSSFIPYYLEPSFSTIYKGF